MTEYHMLDDAMRQRVVDLHKQNYSAPQISDMTGLNADRVRTILKQAGIKLAPARRSAKSEKFPLARPLIEQGMPLKEVSAQTGIPYQTLLRWAREEGYDTGANSPDAQRQRELTPEVVRRYVELEQTAEKIGQELGLSQATVLRWLRDAEVSIRAPKGGSEPRKRNEHILEVLRLHRDEQATSSEIAKATGVSRGTIELWLRSEDETPHYASLRPREGTGWQQRNDAARAEVIRLYTEEFLEPTEIAAKVGVDRSSVHRWIDAAGVRSQGGRYAKNAQQAAEAVRLYVEEQRSVQEIQQILGRSYPSVRGWLESAEVTMRTAWEQRGEEGRRQFAEQGKTASLDRVRIGNEAEARSLDANPGSSRPKTEKQCAAPGCTQPALFLRRYCSDEHLEQYRRVRQGDPENTVIALCQNETGTCPQEGRIFTYPRSAGHRKYCSNPCSQAAQRDEPAPTTDGRKAQAHSETLFSGLCGKAGLPAERLPGEEQIRFGAQGSYGPDFKITYQDKTLFVDTKGAYWVKPESPAKWSAWRTERGRLCILMEEDLDQLYAGMGARGLWSYLNTKAIEQESS